MKRIGQGKRAEPIVTTLASMVLAVALATVAHPALAQRPAPNVPEGVNVLRDLEYARVGDKKLLLDLYLPEKANGPLPVIVGIHGGGWANGSKDGGQGNWDSSGILGAGDIVSHPASVNLV